MLRPNSRFLTVVAVTLWVVLSIFACRGGEGEEPVAVRAPAERGGDGRERASVATVEENSAVSAGGAAEVAGDQVLAATPALPGAESGSEPDGPAAAAASEAPLEETIRAAPAGSEMDPEVLAGELGAGEESAAPMAPSSKVEPFDEASQAAALRAEAFAALAAMEAEMAGGTEVPPPAPLAPPPPSCKSIDQDALSKSFDAMMDAFSALQDALWQEGAGAPAKIAATAAAATAKFAAYRQAITAVSDKLKDDARLAAWIAELPSGSGPPPAKPRYPLLGQVFGGGFDGVPRAVAAEEPQMEGASPFQMAPDRLATTDDGLSPEHATAMAMLDVIRWLSVAAGNITDQIATTCH